MNNTFTVIVELFERKTGWHYVSVPTEFSKPLEYLSDRGLLLCTPVHNNSEKPISLRNKTARAVFSI